MTRGDVNFNQDEAIAKRDLDVFKYWDYISNDVEDKELLNITKKKKRLKNVSLLSKKNLKKKSIKKNFSPNKSY